MKTPVDNDATDLLFGVLYCIFLVRARRHRLVSASGVFFAHAVVCMVISIHD